MTDVVVIAAEADQALAQELASALERAGVTASAQAPGAAIPKTAFVLFCLTNAAPADSALVKLVWIEAPMKDDPTGRFLFAVFDPGAAANEHFAPFVKRHFAAAGDDAEAFAAHINRHRDDLAAQVKAAEEARERYLKEVASRPPLAEQEGIGSGRPPDLPMGVGAALPRRPEGIGAAAEPPRRYGQEIDLERLAKTRERLARIDAEEDARRAAMREAHGAATSAAPAEPTGSSGKSTRRPRDNVLGSGTGPIRPTNDPAVFDFRSRADKVDARAFAPKKLRRGTNELIRVAVFQPKDKGRAMRAAKQADQHTQTAGAAQHLGKIARGAMITALIDARGARVEEARLGQEWTGAPLDFNFVVEASDDANVAQALITIRILTDGAQVGSITFVRPLGKAKKSSAGAKEEKLRRVSRAFLSYSSADRGTVGLIASAYQRAGIPCFFDRSSLSSGEEWSPRLRKEIERADLFHLCWSKQAAASEWVAREAEHAMTSRRARKRPEITIQMLDGPPWAPHPQALDMLNFDDYARAAIVGYARGDGAG